MASGLEINLVVEAARRLGLDTSPQACVEALRPLLGGVGHGCSIAPTVTIVSPEKLVLGRGVTIEGEARIDASSERGILLDDQAVVGWGAFLSAGGEQGHIHLGEGAALGARCQVHGQGAVYIGAHALIGQGALIVSDEQGFEDACTPIYLQAPRLAPVRIGDDVWLGPGARVLGGVEIGVGAVIAAGAVVDADVPPYTVAAGVPARVVRSRGARRSVSP